MKFPFRFIGTRPWEKLYEKSVGRDETVEPSGMDRISSGTIDMGA